jgi:hypothetical protein
MQLKAQFNADRQVQIVTVERDTVVAGMSREDAIEFLASLASVVLHTRPDTTQSP